MTYGEKGWDSCGDDSSSGEDERAGMDVEGSVLEIVEFLTEFLNFSRAEEGRIVLGTVGRLML